MRVGTEPPSVTVLGRGAEAKMTKRGVGGWLLVPACFTALIPFALLANFIDTFSGYREIWQQRRRMPWPNLLLVGLEQGGNFILVVCWFFALYLLFRRSSRYPMFSSVCMAASLILAIVIGLPSTVVYESPLGGDKLISWFVMACVVASWCVYMKRSKRVRDTFVTPGWFGI